MTSQQDVKTFEDIFSEGWHEINRIFRDRLQVAGIVEGALVKTGGPNRPNRLYKILRIDTDVSNRQAYSALYGYEMNNSGSFRTAVSYIGLPHEVEVLNDKPKT